MDLQTFKDVNKHTLDDLATLLGFDRVKCHRIVKKKKYKLSLEDAKHIVAKTNGVVTLEEL